MVATTSRITDALVQRPYKIVVAPIADPGLRVGCDVRGIKGAERQLEGPSASKRLALRRSMASDAVGGPRQIIRRALTGRLPRRHDAKKDAKGTAVILGF